MNEKINYTGGEPTINFDDLNRDDTANRAALFAIMKAFNVDTNENFIISGCVPTLDTGVDVVITAGYIFLNGEILQVDVQTVVNGGTLDLYKYVKSTTYDANGTKTFNDAVSRQTWAKHRGIVTAATVPILTTELDVISGDSLQDKISKILNTNAVVYTKIIDIGTWDMSGALSVTVAHGLDYDKIIGHSVTIRSDSAAVDFKGPINFAAAGNIGGFTSIGTTDVGISKLAGGYYDINSVDFNQTSYNRGFIIIKYLP